MLPDSAAGATATAAGSRSGGPAEPHDLATPAATPAAPPRPDKVRKLWHHPAGRAACCRIYRRLGRHPCRLTRPAAATAGRANTMKLPCRRRTRTTLPSFACVLCQYVAESMAVLVSHRRSAHRGTRFQDTFTSGCACSLVFYARIVATSHAAACARRQQRAVPPSTDPCSPQADRGCLLPTGPRRRGDDCHCGSRIKRHRSVTAATNLQSAVPAAPKPHEHSTMPPPCWSPAPYSVLLVPQASDAD
ncbi:hypothetical protein Pcac1_g28576 [Phytophthora cactorum]|nr:hypothetical protein Pcac1_g28576 [Phytophthora cactorum]